MDMGTTILLILFLLFVGINLAANNRMNQFIVRYLFYTSSTSSIFVRILGVIVLSSIILLLMNFHYYALITNTMALLIFTFLTIQGRSRVSRERERKRQEMELLHKKELEQRRADVAMMRQKKIKELENGRNKPQSVKQMKDKMWNDGSMTNKEIINNLHKD